MTESADLFIEASRKKFRFASIAGDLTVEQLWDLPLSSRNGLDLDTVAKAVNQDLKGSAEESFVTPANNTGLRRNQAKLEVVKFIIAVKIEDREREAKRVAKAGAKRKLLDAIEAAENKELTEASKEELIARLRELELEDA